MSKPFKSLDSLLRLMRKRNITIGKGSEGSRVKRILARDNYYAVINGYKEREMAWKQLKRIFSYPQACNTAIKERGNNEEK